jgi:hypothetical protein
VLIARTCHFEVKMAHGMKNLEYPAELYIMDGHEYAPRCFVGV